MQPKISLIVVLVLARPLAGLLLEPKIEEGNKYSPDWIAERPTRDIKNEENILNETNDNENRIIISEPYKSLIQATARLAIAQSSITDYVTVDTAMDVISDASYALAKPSSGQIIKAVAIAIATITAAAFLIPASLIRTIDSTIRNPERLMVKLDRYLPNGISRMGVVNLLHEKSDDFLARFGLNDSSCREQTICQLGELVRCRFPESSKVAIDFISKNLSRHKYKFNKLFNAFLSGFIDQNCDIDNSPKSCASNFIKSLTFCPPQKSPPGSKPNCQ